MRGRRRRGAEAGRGRETVVNFGTQGAFGLQSRAIRNNHDQHSLLDPGLARGSLGASVCILRGSNIVHLRSHLDSR